MGVGTPVICGQNTGQHGNISDFIFPDLKLYDRYCHKHHFYSKNMYKKNIPSMYTIFGPKSNYSFDFKLEIPQPY